MMELATPLVISNVGHNLLDLIEVCQPSSIKKQSKETLQFVDMPSFVSLKANLGYIPIITRSDNKTSMLTWRGVGSDTNKKTTPLSKSLSNEVHEKHIVQWWLDPIGRVYAYLFLTPDLQHYKIKVKSGKYFRTAATGSNRQIYFSEETKLIASVKFFPHFNAKSYDLESFYLLSNHKTDKVSLFHVNSSDFKLNNIHEPRQFDLTQPVLMNKTELIGVQAWSSTKVFMPLSNKGQKLQKAINLITEKIDGAYNIKLSNINSKKDTVGLLIESNYDYKGYIAEYKNNTFSLTELFSNTRNSGVVEVPFYDYGATYTLSTTEKSSSAPLVVYLHGGPKNQVKYLNGNLNVLDILNSLKVNTLVINFKGSVGQGREYSNIYTVSDFKQSINQITSIINKVCALDFICENGVYFIGESFGSGLLLKALTDKKFSALNNGTFLISTPFNFDFTHERSFRWGPSVLNQFEWAASKEDIKSILTENICIIYGKFDLLTPISDFPLEFNELKRDSTCSYELTTSSHSISILDSVYLRKFLENRLFNLSSG